MKKVLLTILLMLSCFAMSATLDEKISQMIMIGFDGDNVKSKDFKYVLKDINSIGGVILFTKNIQDVKELNKMIKIIKDSSSVSPFVAIDNEGGQVLRFDFVDVKSSKEISKMNYNLAKYEYTKLARANYEAGINLNLAPVVDLALNKDSIIVKKERSFGDDYRTVAKYAKLLIDEHSKYGIVTALKHFPGHGSAKGDTHLGFVDNTQVFEMSELMPYYLLKDTDKTTMVMASHIFNSNIDDKYPASLSSKTINDLLRGYIGFKGVVISDDYDMGAIRDNYSLEKIVTLAINSGVDILLFSNNLKYYDIDISKKIHKIIKRQIKRGKIKQEDIDKSYERIMALKKNMH